MCFYITATLPKDTNIETITNLLNKYNMAFSPLNNKKIGSQLRPDELYLHATKDYCDCDTSLGFLNQEKGYQKLLNSQKVKKLRKKKWTEAKIDEWIKDKLKKNPPHGKRSITQHDRELDIRRWNNFIKDLINLKKVSRVGILKHWYKYNLETEDFTIKRTEKVQIGSLSDDLLLNIEEDVLYEFFPHYNY